MKSKATVSRIRGIDNEPREMMSQRAPVKPLHNQNAHYPFLYSDLPFTTTRSNQGGLVLAANALFAAVSITLALTRSTS